MPSARTPTTPTSTVSPTADRILDVAERLGQTRGFNGFSYADIAVEVGITKASLHYHFATKAELGRALVARYADRFFSALAGIEARDSHAPEKLREYMAIYDSVLNADRMCLCGMLAAEYQTLPEIVQAEVRSFFERNEAWLVLVLEEGRRRGSVDFAGPARDFAQLLTGALEGAMLLSRSSGDASRFGAATGHLLAQLAPRGARSTSG